MTVTVTELAIEKETENEDETRMTVTATTIVTVTVIERVARDPIRLSLIVATPATRTLPRPPIAPTVPATIELPPSTRYRSATREIFVDEEHKETKKAVSNFVDSIVKEQQKQKEN
ncbi:uncharacterized protein LOC109796043 [Cajanus cajan]|uniref:uncharacterized protein LOC109796043 n=1 Tax=Cajanus cajan TaxID=3821 RepID=UPI00098D86AE|nr:uncharacterized protein LOC109796043 [Cajanus cajan]